MSKETVKCPHCRGTGRVAVAKHYPWMCPKCGAKAGEHGKGECRSLVGMCDGLICECDDEGTELHGETLRHRCKAAICNHCGWVGVMPAVRRKS